MASRKPLPCRDVKNKPVTTKGFGKHFNLSSLYCPFISAPLTLPCTRPCCFPSSSGRHHCCRVGLGTAASSALQESCARGPGLALTWDSSKHTFFPSFPESGLKSHKDHMGNTVWETMKRFASWGCFAFLLFLFLKKKIMIFLNI